MQIREERKAKRVAAYFADDDGNGNDRLCVGSLDLTLARMFPELFASWKETMALALRLAIESTGAEIVEMHEVRPGDPVPRREKGTGESLLPPVPRSDP